MDQNHFRKITTEFKEVRRSRGKNRTTKTKFVRVLREISVHLHGNKFMWRQLNPNTYPRGET